MACSELVSRPERSARDKLLIAARVLLVALGAATLLALAARLGWPFELFVHFRIQYAAAGLVLAAVMLAMGRPGASLLAIMIAAFNALPVMQRVEAGQSGLECVGPRFTVVTANVQYVNTDHGRFLRWLATHPSDLVVVQELTSAWARDLSRLPAYPYRAMLPREDAYGIGVLSRWPLGPVGPEDFAGDGLPSLAGGVQVADRPVRFVALHTRWPVTPGLAHERDVSLEAAARSIAAGAGPAVALGDLNATPWSPAYATFLRTSGMRDAANGSRWQPTWLAGFWPLALRIDHVFVSPGLCVEDTHIGPAVGSDHRPLVARLRFAG
jgi:endonuclease/exonuclease/phosphatase (EEP) superfamily protein YafD